jgi:TonB family protein
MDALTTASELTAMTRQTRRLAVWSFVVHAAGAVLLLAVASQPTIDAATNEVLTEITWAPPETRPVEAVALAASTAVDEPPVLARLEPARSESAASAPSVRLPAAAPAAAPATAAHVHETGPDPVAQRLAALRVSDGGQRVVALAGSASVPHTQWASLSPRVTTPARELNRTAVAPVATLPVLTRARPGVVSAAATTPAEPRLEPAVTPAREIQPGVRLAGEVSGRRLREHTVPEYPEWAQRDGVEVSVRLLFTVLADGRVKENVLVERTSGFDDFDRLAMAALAAWRFESLDPGTTTEQWGRVEFKYRLKSFG